MQVRIWVRDYWNNSRRLLFNEVCPKNFNLSSDGHFVRIKCPIVKGVCNGFEERVVQTVDDIKDLEDFFGGTNLWNFFRNSLTQKFIRGKAKVLRSWQKSSESRTLIRVLSQQKKRNVFTQEVGLMFLKTWLIKPGMRWNRRTPFSRLLSMPKLAVPKRIRLNSFPQSAVCRRPDGKIVELL